MTTSESLLSLFALLRGWDEELVIAEQHWSPCTAVGAIGLMDLCLLEPVALLIASLLLAFERVSLFIKAIQFHLRIANGPEKWFDPVHLGG